MVLIRVCTTQEVGKAGGQTVELLPQSDMAGRRSRESAAGFHNEAIKDIKVEMDRNH